MTKKIKGSPYKHYEVSRESKDNSDGKMSCDWCGLRPRWLYRYNNANKWFCNKKCSDWYKW